MGEEGVVYGTCGMHQGNVSAKSNSLNIKSRLGVSYVEVLCSYLDLDCSEPKPGNDVSGWDVRIEPVRTKDEWTMKPRLFS